MTPAASVIVPCRGHAAELSACLRALARQEGAGDYEVIVADSAADPAVAAAAVARPGVRLVRAGCPLGPGEARNLGAAAARAPVLAFTDADCEPAPGWLAAGLAALRAGAVMVGGPVLDARPLHPIAVTDNVLQFMGMGPWRPSGPAPYLPGCNLIVERAAFDALGGFPAVDVGEDTLLSRAAAARWPDGVRFDRGVRVAHAGRAALGPFLRHQASHGYARGRLGLMVRPAHRRLAGHAAAVPAVVLKRLGYIGLRTAIWRPAALPRFLLLLPLAVLGLGVWAWGFRHGCIDAEAERVEV